MKAKNLRRLKSELEKSDSINNAYAFLTVKGTVDLINAIIKDLEGGK